MLPRLSAPMSGVDRPCPWIHANLCCSPLSLSSRQLPSAGSRRQLSFASPYHFRIRRDFMSKNPLSGFAPKQTRLLWRPTHIVLQWFQLFLSNKNDLLKVIYVHVFLCNVRLVTVVEGDLKTPFSIATTPRCRGGRYSFLWIFPLYP